MEDRMTHPLSDPKALEAYERGYDQGFAEGVLRRDKSDRRVQLTPADFIKVAEELPDGVGVPSFWAEWPSRSTGNGERMNRDALLNSLEGISQIGESWGPSDDIQSVAKHALDALRHTESDQRDAARYRWLRDNVEQLYEWLENDIPANRIDRTIDANMKIDAAVRQSSHE